MRLCLTGATGAWLHIEQLMGGVEISCNSCQHVQFKTVCKSLEFKVSCHDVDAACVSCRSWRM